jgi:hypothetical protein
MVVPLIGSRGAQPACHTPPDGYHLAYEHFDYSTDRRAFVYQRSNGNPRIHSDPDERRDADSAGPSYAHGDAHTTDRYGVRLHCPFDAGFSTE